MTVEFTADSKQMQAELGRLKAAIKTVNAELNSMAVASAEAEKSTEAQEKANRRLSSTLSVMATGTKAYRESLEIHSSSITKTYNATTKLAAASFKYDKELKRDAIATLAQQVATDKLNASFAELVSLEADLILKKNLGYKTLQKEILATDRLVNTEERAAKARKKAAAMLNSTYVEAQKAIKAKERLVATNKRLESSNKRLESSSKRLESSSKRVYTSQNQLRSAFRGTAGALGGLWLAYGDILPMMGAFATASTARAAITQGAAFAYTTKYLTSLNEVAGDTTLTLDDIKDRLLGMGSLRHTPEQLAEGMMSFSRAGVEASKGLNDLAEMSRFASLANIDLSYAIEKTIGTAQAFGETYADTANMIYAGATSSATSVEDMMTAISQATSLGVVAGLELKDTLTGLAAAAKSGIFGSKAGTSIRTSIIRLQTATSKFNKMLREMGLEFKAFNKDGSPKDLITLFTDLSKVLDELSPEDKTKVLREGLGLRAMKGGAAVLRELNDGLAELRDKIGNAPKGETLIKQITKDLDETTVQKWERLKNVFSSILIRTGDSKAVGGFIALLKNSLLGWEAIFAKMSGDTERLAELQAAYNNTTLSTEDRLNVLIKKRDQLQKELANEKLMADVLGQVYDENTKAELKNIERKIQAIRKEKLEHVKLAEAATIRTSQPQKVFDNNAGVFSKIDNLNALQQAQSMPKDPWMNPNIQKEREAALERGRKLENDILIQSEKANLKAAKNIKDTWLAYYKGKKEAEIRSWKLEQKGLKYREDIDNELYALTHSNKEARINDLEQEYQEKREQLQAYGVFDKDTEQMLADWKEEKRNEILTGHKNMLAEMKDAWEDYKDFVEGSISSLVSSSVKSLIHGSTRYDSQLASIEAKLRSMRYKSLKTGTEQMQFLSLEYDRTLKDALNGSDKAFDQYMDNLDEYLSKAKEELSPEEYNKVYSQTMDDLNKLNKEYSDDTKAVWKDLKDSWDSFMDSLLTKFIDILADMVAKWAAAKLFGGEFSFGFGDSSSTGGSTSLLGSAYKAYQAYGTGTTAYGYLGSGVTSGGATSSLGNAALYGSSAYHAFSSGIGTTSSWYAGSQAASMGVNSGTSLALTEGTYGAGTAAGTTGGSTAASTTGVGGMSGSAATGLGAVGIGALISIAVANGMNKSLNYEELLTASGYTPGDFLATGADDRLSSNKFSDRDKGLGYLSDWIQELSISAKDGALVIASAVEGIDGELTNMSDYSLKVFDESSAVWSDQTDKFDSMLSTMLEIAPATDDAIISTASYLTQMEGLPSVADELTRAYAEQTDQIILSRGSEEEATKLYLESMYGVEAANGRIVSIYKLVEEAALGDGRAMSRLTDSLVGLGMTQSEAASAASYLASNTGKLADMWSEASSASSSLAAETSGMSNAIDQSTSSVNSMSKVVADFTGAFSTAAGQIHRSASSLRSISTASYSGVVEHHADGGIVGGVLSGGSGVRDDLYLGTVNGKIQLAKGGEFIVNPIATARHREELERINADRYAGGGIVGKSKYESDTAVEIRLLREDMKSANYAIAKNTKDTARLLKKIDAIGIQQRA